MVINFNVRYGASQGLQEAGRDCSLCTQGCTQDHCLGTWLSTVSQLLCRRPRSPAAEKGIKEEVWLHHRACWIPRYATCLPFLPFPSVLSTTTGHATLNNRPLESSAVEPHGVPLKAQNRECVQGTQTWLAEACPLSATGMWTCAPMCAPAPLPEQQALSRIRNPTPGGLRIAIAEERASVLLGCKYLGIQGRWKIGEQRRTMAESLGVVKTRITGTRHISIAPFFPGTQRPPWVGRPVPTCALQIRAKPLGSSVPGRGAPPRVLGLCFLQRTLIEH